MYAPVAVAIGSMVLYHLSQKSVSGCASPFGVLAVAYCMCMLASLGMVFIVEGAKPAVLVRDFSIWVPLLALAIIGIEGGVLWSYRVGVPMTTLPVISAGAVPLTLLPIGLIFFKERLSLSALFGGALVVVGVWLMFRR